jgi:RimJ/RimL family protein N-acetyltransferase
MMTEELLILGDKVRLRQKKVSDAARDFAWQSDAELAQLDAAPTPAMSFQTFLAEYTREIRFPAATRCRFAIESLEGGHIGNCTYYSIDEKRGEAELGIMIGNREYWGQGYGTSAVKTLVDHIFRQTRLNRIHLKTLETNLRAQHCFARCGFTPYGHVKRDGYAFLLMELKREQWTPPPEPTAT